MNDDTQPWGPTTGNLDHTNLLANMEEFAATEQRRMQSASTSWRWWADRLDDLTRTIPNLPAPARYMDESGDHLDTTFGAQHIHPAHLRDLLHRVVADADAVAAALLRSAEQAEDRQRHALDIARGLVRTDTPERVP